MRKCCKRKSDLEENKIEIKIRRIKQVSAYRVFAYGRIGEIESNFGYIIYDSNALNFSRKA